MPDRMRNACIAALAALVCLAPARADERVKLVVLHVNDLHGYAVPREFLGEQLPPEALGQEVGSLFSAATLVKRWREKLGQDGVLMLDGGDTYSGALDDFETEGGNAIELENAPQLGVDAAAVGNHSWDFGPKRWKELAAKITPHHPLVCANLKHKSGAAIPFLKDYAIVEKRGVRIAIIGLIANGALESAAHENTADFKVEEPMKRLKAVLEDLAKLPEGQRPQLTCVLGHVAFERGKPPLHEALAALDDETPGDDKNTALNVDLVIDAHSHVDHTVKVDANTWLVQADHYGVKLGEVELEVDRKTGKLAAPPVARRVPLLASQVPLDADMSRQFADLVARARAANDRPVAKAAPGLKLPMLLRTDRASLSNASGNLFTRALLEIGRQRYGKEVQVALVNQTGVRAGLYASKTGALTAGAVHAVSPFANKLSVVKVSRKDLAKVLDQGVQHTSKLSWAGLKLVAKQKGTGPGADTHRAVDSVELLDATGAASPLAAGDAPVTVIAPSFLAGRELKAVVIEGSRVDLDLTDREALTGYLTALERQHGSVTAPVVEQVVGQPARLVIE